MRISDQQRYIIAESRVNDARSQNADALEQISSQKKINRVSDDPVSYTQSMQRETSINDIGRFAKNIDFSKGYIERAEASLIGIHDFLIRAKEISVSLANDTYDAGSREAASKEVKEIIEGVVGLANAQYGNRYVFGGFRTKTPPLSRDGNFLGDDGAIFLQIDHGNFRQINIQARGLFSASQQERTEGHNGMIECLELLLQGLRTNDVDLIRSMMNELDHQLSKASSYQATLGSIYNGVESIARRLDLSEEIAIKELSKLEDADTYKVISGFKRAESVLQSTLAASNKLLQPSLLNFMQ